MISALVSGGLSPGWVPMVTNAGFFCESLGEQKLTIINQRPLVQSLTYHAQLVLSRSPQSQLSFVV